MIQRTLERRGVSMCDFNPQHLKSRVKVLNRLSFTGGERATNVYSNTITLSTRSITAKQRVIYNLNDADRHCQRASFSSEFRLRRQHQRCIRSVRRWVVQWRAVSRETPLWERIMLIVVPHKFSEPSRLYAFNTNTGKPVMFDGISNLHGFKIAEALETIVNDCCIQPKICSIVTDNASNMRKALCVFIEACDAHRKSDHITLRWKIILNPENRVSSKKAILESQLYRYG